jgi:hypothetical protein
MSAGNVQTHGLLMAQDERLPPANVEGKQKFSTEESSQRP